MPSSVAIGFSQLEDPKKAAHQAAVAVKNELNSIATDMVILFTSMHYPPNDILEVIHTILKPKRLIGTTGFGIILSMGIYNRGIAIAGINSTEIQFGIGSHPHKSNESSRQRGFEISRQMLSDAKTNMPKRASVIFYDALSTFRNPYLLGTTEVLGNNCRIMGAFPHDQLKLKSNCQFFQKQALFESTVGFMISTELPVVLCNKHGFKPLGKPRVITSVEGNIIHTIDNKPAVHIYEDFLKKEAANLKSGLLNSPAVFYPLGIYVDNLSQYLLRYPIDILNDGSIVCQAEVPPETEVHLMITNKDLCKTVAAQAAVQIKDGLGKRQAQLIILINSMGKHKILGRHAFSEVQAITDILGPVPIIGLYSYGELCPLKSTETVSHLQNGSLSILAIG